LVGSEQLPQEKRPSFGLSLYADGWGDDVRLSDIEPNFTCTKCGKKGAEIRPDFPQAKMGA
jgi:hypothetical protein